MATFKTQVEDLAGSIGDDTALEQWLADGVKEIINILPPKLKSKCAAMTVLANATPMDMDGLGEILFVTRENANSGYHTPCREIAPQYGHLAEDSGNLIYYATSTDPVYYIGGADTGGETDASKLTILPDPSAAQPANVHHISYPSVSGADALIANFPDEAEYLVVLYATVKGLHRKLNDKSSSLPSDLSVPVLDIMSTSLPTFTSPSDFVLPIKPSVPSLSAQSVSITGTAPTYVKPTRTVQTAFNDYWTLGDFGDSDPGAFSITAVAPIVPSSPSFSTPGVASVTVSNIGTPPTYTSPNVTGDGATLTAESTALSTGQIGVDIEFLEFDQWFTALGEMIEDDEDIELASAQIEKINSYVQTYNIAMQDKLNIFNDAAVEYQAKLQEAIQQAQINAQEAQAEASLLIQKETQEYSSKLNRFKSELSTYQQNVQKEVQEYTNKLSRYQLELTTVYQTWAKVESDNITSYQADIQNELNNFNDTNTEYQAKLKKDIQDAQFLDANETKKLQKYQAEGATYGAELNVNVQKFTQELTKNRASFDTSMTKYQTESQKITSDNQMKVQKFSAEVNNYAAQIQKNTTDYTWLQGQYMQLKADYQQGLQQLISSGIPQQQQERRGR